MRYYWHDAKVSRQGIICELVNHSGDLCSDAGADVLVAHTSNPNFIRAYQNMVSPETKLSKVIAQKLLKSANTKRAIFAGTAYLFFISLFMGKDLLSSRSLVASGGDLTSRTLPPITNPHYAGKNVAEAISLDIFFMVMGEKRPSKHGYIGLKRLVPLHSPSFTLHLMRRSLQTSVQIMLVWNAKQSPSLEQHGVKVAILWQKRHCV